MWSTTSSHRRYAGHGRFRQRVPRRQLAKVVVLASSPRLQTPPIRRSPATPLPIPHSSEPHVRRFLAGEAGPEHVEITPARGRGRRAIKLKIALVFNVTLSGVKDAQRDGEEFARTAETAIIRFALVGTPPGT
jgi:hypothetical protein